jgi:ribosomal protein L37AE/L43A
MECAKCGKTVDRVCASCWNCKDCGDEFCKEHMKRTLNGVIRANSDFKKRSKN